MQYKIVFVDDVLGKAVVKQFFDSCSNSLLVKILRQLQYLEEFGITRENPHLRRLVSTPFWEIRILGKQNVRILCTPYRKTSIIIIHAFLKKSNKTPEKELEKAISLLKKAIAL